MTEGNANLQKLIEVIEQVPDELWTMGIYRRDTECGTRGCALGQFTAALPDADLQIYKDSCGRTMFLLNSDPSLGMDDVVCLFFGVDEDQATRIFWPEDLGISRAEEISRIREVMEENERAEAMEGKAK